MMSLGLIMTDLVFTEHDVPSVARPRVRVLNEVTPTQPFHVNIINLLHEKSCT